MSPCRYATRRGEHLSGSSGLSWQRRAARSVDLAVAFTACPAAAVLSTRLLSRHKRVVEVQWRALRLAVGERGMSELQAIRMIGTHPKEPFSRVGYARTTPMHIAPSHQQSKPAGRGDSLRPASDPQLDVQIAEMHLDGILRNEQTLADAFVAAPLIEHAKHLQLALG